MNTSLEKIQEEAREAFKNSGVWDSINLKDGSLVIKEAYKLNLFIKDWLARAYEAGEAHADELAEIEAHAIRESQ